MRNLSSSLRRYCAEQGARLVGFADAARLAEAPKGHRAGDFLPGARSVVVLGLPILRAYRRYPEFLKDSEKVPETLSIESTEHRDGGLVRTQTATTHRPRLQVGDHVYRRCCYEFLNMELQRLSLYAALYLEDRGHEAIYLPTAYGSTFTWNMSWPRPNFMGAFSTRHAAVAAGLGRFGLNNLVLTPQYGAFQRFVAIITTAALVPDPLLPDEICLGENCGRCRRGCPNECFGPDVLEYAFGGTRARVWKMDKAACGRYECEERRMCTRQCLFHCPVGKRRPAAPEASGETKRRNRP